MFEIDTDKTIHLTRGDIAVIEVGAETANSGKHLFQVGSIIRLGVFEKNNYDAVVLQKDVNVEVEVPSVDISLTSNDTKIGDIINKSKDYWYEIVLNPDTSPQTLIGHDKLGPKIFRLYPEGADIK